MQVIGTLRGFLRSQMFHPGPLAVFFNPYYIIRRGLSREVSRHASRFKGKMLDVGCGQKPYQKLFPVELYVGLDIENPGHSHKDEKIEVFYDGRRLPFRGDSFDCALSSEVLEHVFHPQELLKEVNRVLKPDGLFLITLPFVWDEHEMPNDFGRYTSVGIAHLIEEAGFAIVDSRKTTNYIQTIFQMLAAYVYQHCIPSNVLMKGLIGVVLVSPILIVGLSLGKILPRNYASYHNNVVLCKKVVGSR